VLVLEPPAAEQVAPLASHRDDLAIGAGAAC
jgi:hypothetical protein